MAYEVAGGATGLVVGAIGGAVQAYEAKKQASRLRRRVRAGIAAGEAASARSVAGALATPEFITAQNFVRSFFGIQPNNAREIRDMVRGEFGSEPLGALKGEAGFMSNRLNRAFGRAAAPTALDSLTTDFLKGLQQAQSERGLTVSQAGAAGEAAGLSAFRANLQIGLLPQLFNLATFPATLRAQVEPGHLQRGVAAATGGAAAYGVANPAALGPAGILGPALAGGVAGLSGGAAVGAAYGGGGAGPTGRQPTIDELLGESSFFQPNARSY